MVVQGEVIKEFLYRKEEEEERVEVEEEERKKGQRRKQGEAEWRTEEKVSISLYLPGKNVKRTKQMNWEKRA